MAAGLATEQRYAAAVKSISQRVSRWMVFVGRRGMSRTNPFPAQSLHSGMIPAQSLGTGDCEGMPCVGQMLYRLSSERTRRPWIRRLFRYQEWLIGEGYLGSLASSVPRDISSVIISGGRAAGTRSAHDGARSRHEGTPRPFRQSCLGRGLVAISVLSSPLSSRARRSLPLRRQSTPSARRRSATWRLRRGSPCR